MSGRGEGTDGVEIGDGQGRFWSRRRANGEYGGGGVKGRWARWVEGEE